MKEKSTAMLLMALLGTPWGAFSDASVSKKAEASAKLPAVITALGVTLRESQDEDVLMAGLLCLYEWCMPGAEGGPMLPPARQGMSVPSIARVLKSTTFPRAQYMVRSVEHSPGVPFDSP